MQSSLLHIWRTASTLAKALSAYESTEKSALSDIADFIDLSQVERRDRVDEMLGKDRRKITDRFVDLRLSETAGATQPRPYEICAREDCAAQIGVIK